MKQLKPFIIIAAVLIVLSFSLPSILVVPFTKDKVKGELSEVKPTPKTEKVTESITEVAVFRNKTNKIEKLPLEEYVIGVVASEMPAEEFELEALKAQALAARTYIVNHLLNANKKGIPDGADIKDTTQYQVFNNEAELKEIWGDKYEENLRKVSEAVEETAGEILTYKEKPITASFFSTSNGYTENAEDYWENQIPYLKSVESPWDSQSPKFTSQKTLSIKEFENKLGIKIKSEDIGTITARTSGKKVAAVKIGGKDFTGRDIREKLELRSTDFSWVRKGDSIVITTKGFGHGVGMSQYGANGMAIEGKNYVDIVNHYYKDIDITNANQFFDQRLASK